MFQRNFNLLSKSSAAEWCGGIRGELPVPANLEGLTGLAKLGQTWLKHSEATYQSTPSLYRPELKKNF